MKRILLAATAIAALTGSALVADLSVKAEPVVRAPVMSWTGCYIGIQGGGAWGRSRHDGIIYQLGDANQYTPWFDVKGGLAGVEGGCNSQLGSNWVLGVEGDISWTNKKGSSLETGPLAVIQGDLGVTDETKEKWISTLRGRIGWTQDRALFFVTGGIALAKVEAVINVPPSFGPANTGSFATSNTLYGWTVGAGLEYAVWSNWSLKAEYLYARFGNQLYRFPGTPVVNIPRGGLNLDDHIVRIGLNWRFICQFGCVAGKY